MNVNINHVISVINNCINLGKDSEIVGALTRGKQILAFGDDSKIVGRLFEILSKPFLEKAAEILGYQLESNGIKDKQTDYPDYIFDLPNGKYIAIDIKSTYRRYYSLGKNKKRRKHFRYDGTYTDIRPFHFTLSSFSSFLRDNHKNIIHHYSDYEYHLILGYIYTRNPKATITATDINDISNIKSPYTDIKYFVQQKYKIGGEKPASGNTNNIGTFNSNSIKDFIKGISCFSYFDKYNQSNNFGNKVFEDYWKHYPTSQSKSNQPRTKNYLPYTDLNGYLNWKSKQNRNEAYKLNKLYHAWQDTYQFNNKGKHFSPYIH